jgi:hypothetical protein
MNRDGYIAQFGDKHPYSEEWTGLRYKYGYTNRPFAMAHQPKGFIIGGLDQEVRIQALGVRHGTIEYPFELSTDEVRNFELVFLGIFEQSGSPVTPMEVSNEVS